MEEPIAKARREAIHATFDSEPLISRIKDLLKKHNEDWIIRRSGASCLDRNLRCIFAFCWPITLE
jgi:hypothetical protein